MVLLAGALAAQTQAARTLYAVNSTAARIYPSLIGGNGGLSLEPLVATGLAPTSIALTPDGRHLFLSTEASNPISVYTVNSSDGTLIGTSSVALSYQPVAMAAPPSNSILLTVSALGTVTKFDLDANATPSNPSTVTVAPDASTTSDIGATPDGKFIFVPYGTTSGTGGIAEFDGTGPLQATTVAIADAPLASIAVTPDGSKIYVTQPQTGAVFAYRVGSDGALAEIPGSPYLLTAGVTELEATPDGRRIAIANTATGSVTPANINSDGSLTFSAGISGFPGATSLAVSPDSKHVYVGSEGEMAALNFANDGSLAAQGSDLIATGSFAALAISPDQAPIAAFDPVPGHAGAGSQFRGDVSYDPDGAVSEWQWDFGDGTTGIGAIPTHVYTEPGEYHVQLTVTDNEGCSVAALFTGQIAACNGSRSAMTTRIISVPPAPDESTPAQPCAHDGNDGFCGTPDQKAPQATILGINDGASINDIDAPIVIAGSITPDPSGIQAVKLRFSKAAGTIRAKKTVRRKVCRTRRVHGTKKRTCTRKRVTIRTNTKVPACQTVSGTHNYLVTYQCTKVPWIAIPAANDQFRYDLPVALGLGTYSIQVLATDGAGNSDVIEKGRNSLTFKVVKTPANTGTGAGDTSGGTTTGPTTTPPPVNDTGSPF